LQNQSERDWSKWDAVVTRLADYHRWYDKNARIVGMILLSVEHDTEEFLADLYVLSRDVSVVLVSHALLQHKSEEYWSDNFDNLLPLEELHERYPFLGAPWDGTADDAVALFAHLMRYHSLVDVTVSRSGYPLSVLHGAEPQEAWLCTQFFRHSVPARHAELQECLRQNLLQPYLDRVVLFNERDESAEWKEWQGAEKIQQVVIGERLTYGRFLRYVHDVVPKGVFALLANADIYFGDSLLELWKVNWKDRMMALLRWDVQEDGEATLFGPRADSQDAWMVLSDSVQERTWTGTTFDFPLGKPGCDNAFAAHMLRQRFVLCNPALSFVSYHLHRTAIRDYTKRDTIRSDLYINLVPTYLIDTKQETVPSGSPSCLCHQLVSFEIRSSSMSNEITYCTMLEKDGRYKWEPTVENHYFEPAIPVYRWNQVGVTLNGLVYEPYRIYTGKHVDEFPYWTGTEVHAVTPMVRRERMLALPFPDSTLFDHPDTYALQYLSRCFRLWNEYPGYSFWLPPCFPMNLLDWNGVPSGPSVDTDGGHACWAEEVVGWVPGPLGRELGQEDVEALRARAPCWKPTPQESVCVVLLDAVLTAEWVTEEVLPWLRHKCWQVRLVSASDPDRYEKIAGAMWCILQGGPSTHWSSLWALPRSSCVVEFQQELALDGQLQHLCHVGDMKSWILLLSKGTVRDVREQIMEQLMKWYTRNSSEFADAV